MIFQHILSVSVLILVLAVSLAKSSIVTNRTGVVGGDVTFPGEFPWIVVLQRRSIFNGTAAEKFLCAGSLLDWNIVISSAHCVYNATTRTRVPTSDIIVAAGVFNLDHESGTEQYAHAIDIRIHEDFRWTNLEHDIALIKLDTKFNVSSNVSPILLPTFDVLGSLKLKSALVAGWGSNRSIANASKLSPRLLMAEVAFTTPDKCDLGNGNFQICAGGNGTDACAGDAGGPLMCSHEAAFVLCGVVSYTRGKICGNIPGVFSNVFAYTKWIAKNREFRTIYSKSWTWGVFGGSIAAAVLIALVFLVIYRKTRVRPETEPGEIEYEALNTE